MSTITTRSGKGSALSTAEMDSNLTNLNTDKLENVSEDTTPQLGGDLDVNGNSIVSTSNGNIDLTPDGTGLVVAKRLRVNDGTNGVISVDQANGNLNLTSGSGTGAVNIISDTGLQIGGDSSDSEIFTSTSNNNLKLSSNGTGNIFLNSAGGVEISDTGSSGYGVLSGSSSTGIGLATNDFAQAGTDPQLTLDNGGGATLTAGSGSELTLTGSTVDVNGTTTMNDQITFDAGYIESIHTSTTTTGTYAPDAANGSIHYVVMTGSMTVNAFSNLSAGQTITLLLDNTGGSYTLTLGDDILTPSGDGVTLSGGFDMVTITCVNDTSGSESYVAVGITDFQ